MEDIINQATIITALATTGILQLLKLRIVPTNFVNKYPVPSLLVVSTLSAVLITAWNWVNPTGWKDWVVMVAVIAVSAALTYRTTLQNWTELRSLEG
jgi:hypothetical protein